MFIAQEGKEIAAFFPLWLCRRFRLLFGGRHRHILLAQLLHILPEEFLQSGSHADRGGIADNKQHHAHQEYQHDFGARRGQQNAQDCGHHTANDTAQMQGLPLLPQLNQRGKGEAHAGINHNAVGQCAPEYRE